MKIKNNHIKIFSFLLVFAVITSLFSFPASALSEPDFEIQAKNVILYNVDTDSIIYQKNPDEKIYPASVTKLLSALVLVDKIKNYEEVLTITQEQLDQVPMYASIVNLKVGEEMSVDNLMKCSLISSGNDATIALADHFAGSTSDFAKLMNTKAKELGCNSSNFVNPTGLHDENHYTTARDLLIIAKAAYNNEKIRSYVKNNSAVIPETNKSKERKISNTNMNLNQGNVNYYKYVDGLKTGTTTPAGYCFISSSSKNNLSYICVMMNAPKTANSHNPVFADTKKLLNWAYSNFSMQTVLSSESFIGEVPVIAGKKADYIVAVPKENISGLVEKNIDQNLLKKDFTLKPEVVAPINKGDNLGSLTVTYDGQVLGTYDLVAQNSISRNNILYILYVIGEFFKITYVKIGVILFGILFIMYVLLAIRHNNKKKRKNKNKTAKYRR